MNPSFLPSGVQKYREMLSVETLILNLSCVFALTKVISLLVSKTSVTIANTWKFESDNQDGNSYLSGIKGNICIGVAVNVGTGVSVGFGEAVSVANSLSCGTDVQAENIKHNINAQFVNNTVFLFIHQLYPQKETAERGGV